MIEPLQIVDSLIYRLTDSDGVNTDEINVTMWSGSRNAERRAEGARRVLACMDACADIPDEVLPSLKADYSACIRQRDELLAALKTLSWAFEISIHDHQDSGSWQAARAAIAKAEAKP